MKNIYPIVVAVVIVLLISLMYAFIGFAFAFILGASAIMAYVVWLLTTYPNPADGQKILPLYLLAISMQYIHMTEEFVAGFPHAFSLFTGSNFPSDTFVLLAVLGGGVVYTLTGFGLIHRHPIANYVLWFFLIGPAGLVNSIAHFTLPFLSGSFYFPGLITVLLPTVAGTALAWQIIRDSRSKPRKSSKLDKPATSIN